MLIDESLAFRAEGYLFGHRRFTARSTDVLHTRLLGREVTMLRGHGAAELFYRDGNFDREGAMPRSVLHSLQDEGSVQTLSGRPHHERKALFLDVLDGGAGDLAAAFERHWWAAQSAWPERDRISVLDESAAVLTRAALDWLGLPWSESSASARNVEIDAMLEGAGSFGWRNWRGRALRRRTEAWARERLTDVRSAGAGEPSSVVRRVAEQLGASDLSLDVAVVELLNLLRPVTAISRFIAFAALALERHPRWRERVAEDDEALDAFVAEVRRTAPFFPVIGGRATRGLTWQDSRIDAGDWVILDLFATNRHPGEWIEAWTFDPSRFLVSRPGEVVAQGAGPYRDGHRCPGEPVTVDLLALATGHLARAEWVPADRDLSVDLSRIPARPGRHGMPIRYRSARR